MDNLVALLSNRNDESSNQEIVDYSTKNLNRLVSDWSYAANTSSHGSYGTYTIALATILEIPEFPSTNATSLCHQILKEEMKSIYRALTMARPAQTVPTITLLTRMVPFCSAEILTEFDFTLSIIRKLLSQQPFRNAFLKFYIALIHQTTGPNRRELISNRKVVSLWFGKLSTDDDDDMISLTVETLLKYVLKDTTNFTKSAKMGIFNDWTLRNFVKILARVELPQNIIDGMDRFILTLLCDKTYGVRMSTGGEQKLALSFLKIIKPWENTYQMDLVVRLLEDSPDLFVPYFDQLSLVFNLAPKASMWWISFSVLHIRALKLDSKRVLLASFGDLTKAAKIPHIGDISKAVLPATVSKSSLTQALSNTQSSFIRFQAAQIVLFGLRRLSYVIEQVYKPSGQDYTGLVENILGSRLPEVSIFSKECEPPLLKTTFYIIIKEIGRLYPLKSVPVSLNLAAKEVSGLELIQVENLLAVQGYAGDQTKWWNPAKGASFSLFTQLLKFATFNFRLSEQCGQLLQHLAQPTQLFADIQTLTSPVDALLFTLSVVHNDITWELIEQAIQRAIKSPYQYIDKVQSARVSPFIVALVEQYDSFFAEKEKKVDKSQPSRKWIRFFARSLVVLGEDEKIMENLLGVEPLAKECNGGGSEEYFNFVLDAKNDNIVNRKDLLFKISNRLELAGTIYRICHDRDEKVRNYLLASLPADVLPVLASEPPGFLPFFSGQRELLKAFLVTIDTNNSIELIERLQKSPDWDLGIPRLSDEFLLAELENSVSNTKVLGELIAELTDRKICVPRNLLEKMLDTKALSKNLELWEPNSISQSEGQEIINSIRNDSELAAQTVRISGFYSVDHPLSQDPAVLVVAAKYASEKLDRNNTLSSACDLLRKGNYRGLTIIVNLGAELDKAIGGAISEYVESCKSKLTQSVLHGEIVEIISGSSEETPFIGRWLKIAIHELTKRYAEGKMFVEHYSFLEAFNAKTLGGGIDIWSHVNPNAINGLIEAIMRHDRHCISFELVSRIALQSATSSQYSHGVTSRLNSLAHVSTLLEKGFISSTAEIEMAEVLALWGLITVNVESCSTQTVEQGLLIRYNASLSPKDRMIYDLLQQIESIRQRSWVDQVESWDVRPARAISIDQSDEYGLDPLIAIKGNNKAFVTLDEQRIRETTQFFEPHVPFHTDNIRFDYQKLKEEIVHYELIMPSRGGSLYDPNFLLNLVVSCDYLMENLEVFLTSGLLSFVFCCLTNSELCESALNVLKYAFASLDKSNFRDKVSVRLLIGKTLSLYSDEREDMTRIPSHVPVITGQIALILANPNHFMYSMAVKWLLSSPSIQHSDIPLCNSIISSQSDLKLREMVWLVNALKSGAIDEYSVQSYVRSGVIEWTLSQYRLINSRSSALRDSIQGMIDRIEEVKCGSMTLINTSAGLAVPEIKQRLFYSAGPNKVAQQIR